ncbi:MAG: metal-dependent hydrolase [Pseudomonadales bacterium]|nr:metal-dependent hydrolase [Pseudomonadales bacterium]
MALVNRKIGYDEVETRDLKFNMDSSKVSKYWFNNDPWNTLFMSSVLAAVPDGERWVMQSVRKQLDMLTDPSIRKAGIEFIHQERIHAREHDVMNKASIEHGIPMDDIERTFRKVRMFLQKRLSINMQGALGAAFEHFTATIASVLIEHPETFKDTNPELLGMLFWHFVEETEHKSVSFDVFTDAAGGGLRAYLLRVTAMTSAAVAGASVFSIPFTYLLYKDKQLTNFASAKTFFRTQFVDPGVLRKVGSMFFPYFRRDFHPWDDDNREVIHAWKQEYNKSGDPTAAFLALCDWLAENRATDESKLELVPASAAS